MAFLRNKFDACTLFFFTSVYEYLFPNRHSCLLFSPNLLEPNTKDSDKSYLETVISGKAARKLASIGRCKFSYASMG